MLPSLSEAQRTEMALEEQERLEATVRGRVQGVGFRASVQWKAQELGLSGYVRNMWDGSVEVKAEGPKDRLEKLLAYLRRGPRFAAVEAVDYRFLPALSEFSGFRIR